ncbi:hypothetical protein [Lysobacter antibioticus]|uniref:hypothetical protein n=2 Tax=Lysobacteraceae TaxID=32033 RepID=UPI0004D01C45|nr:hypothetical protein [Lysobacter antibioticus]
MSAQLSERSEVAGHYPDKIGRAACMFYREVAANLKRLEGVAAANGWQPVSELSQRIRIDALLSHTEDFEH